MAEAGLFTGGDDKYFELIADLIDSIRKINTDITIIVIDGGLNAENIQALKAKNVTLVNPTFCDDLIGINFKSKINILRLNLDRICEEYHLKLNTLIWLDADTWVQKLDYLLDLCFTVTKKNKLAIKAQISRLDTRSINTRKIINYGTFSLFMLRNILYKNSRNLGFTNDTIQKLESVPTLNSGVFALDIKSPHWNRFRYWQKYIIENGGNSFSSDQLAIGYTIYLDNFTFELLPDTCNYFCGYKMRWNEMTKKFVDYYPPYEEISVIHHCGLTKFKKDWDKIEIIDMNDEKIIKSILYRFNLY